VLCTEAEWDDDENYAKQYAEEINSERNPEHLLTAANVTDSAPAAAENGSNAVNDDDDDDDDDDDKLPPLEDRK
jgi:hypothetical protein